MRRGTLGAAFVLLAMFCQTLAPASAQTAPTATATLAEHLPGVVLVGFVPGAPASARAEALRSVGASSSEQLSPLAPDARIVHLGGGTGVEAAISALSRNPNVRYAEPDYVVHATASDANDPGYDAGMPINGTTFRTWGLYGPTTSPATNDFGSGAGQIWKDYSGSRSIYVGIIDTGIQILHPDLKDNIWTNPGETAGNSRDDDGNGYIDDVNGWDFANGNKTVYDSSSADYHGTHVAGTIGARGDNSIGVPGVNWQVTMIPAKFLGTLGGATSNAVRALDYLTDLKYRLGIDLVATNNSWGGGGYSQSLLDAINRGGDAGILFIAAAGNDNLDNDANASYPSNYVCTTPSRAWDCVLAVASIDSGGGLSSFSDYGATTVDLGAPGSDILSTYPGGYAVLSGTSMATPHVTGAVALCASMGSRSGSTLRQALLDGASATPTTSLSSKTLTGGRLSLPAMRTACANGGARPAVTSNVYPLSVTVDRVTVDGITGSGTVTSNPSVLTCTTGTCSANVTKGTSVILTAAAAAGSVFRGWSGGGCSGTSSSCTVGMSQLRTVTASFGPASYTMTVGVTRPSRTKAYVTITRVTGTSWSQTCTSSCSKSVTFTSTYSIVATTSSGATTYAWGGACSGTVGNTCTVTVSGTRSASIAFSP